MENEHSDDAPTSFEKQTREALQTTAKRLDRIERDIESIIRSNRETAQQNSRKTY